MDQRDHLRAADTDRQAIADRLRDALNEGRLDLSEYDERVQKAYAAKTYGDLNGLLDDLPSVAPAQRSQLAPRVGPTSVEPSQSYGRGWFWYWQTSMWGGWLTTAITVLIIWGLISLSAGHLTYFWPVWVIVPSGVAGLLGTVSTILTGAPRRSRERRRRRRDR